MSDGYIDPETDPFIRAVEKVADAIETMAEMGAARGYDEETIEDYVQQAVFVWKDRLHRGR